ncbi:hypothetical protein B0H14DRAFT_3141033 [Mycena olivaceomarginata]|nr:hypothetical protein B0H14DRAFT_3141033 [Mycena olivaceomarginata]
MNTSYQGYSGTVVDIDTNFCVIATAKRSSRRLGWYPFMISVSSESAQSLHGHFPNTNFLLLPLFGALSEPFGGVTRHDKRHLSSSPPQSSAQTLFQGSSSHHRLFLGSHRLGIPPFPLRAMSESKAHDQGHVVQFLRSLLTWDFGAIFVVYGPLVAALLPQYWHEARLDKRQEQSILWRYPVPDRGAVVGQGSAPKRTCTVPPDAWYCRAAQCVEMSLGGRSMAPASRRFPPMPALLEAPSAPYLRRHGYGPSPCFRHTAGTLPGLLKRATGAPVRRECRRMRGGVDARGYCRKLRPCPQNVLGTQHDFPTDGRVRESGSYPVEAQFQQSDGAWSVCARPRSGTRDAPRSASCAPAATTPAETSTWVGPLGPADGVAGPRGAERYAHLYGGPVRRSVSGVYWEELRPAQWVLVPGGAELRGAGRGSASHGLQYGIGPPHFHPTTAHVPHGRRLPVEAKNSSSTFVIATQQHDDPTEVRIYHGSTKIRETTALARENRT